MKEISLYFILIIIQFQLILTAYGQNNSFQTLHDLISTGINYSANPCDDFYTHACSSWVQKTTVRQRSYLNIILLARDVLLNNTTAQNEIRNEELTKERLWFKNCMKTDLSKEKELMVNTIRNFEGLSLPNKLFNYQPQQNWQNIAESYARSFGEIVFFNIKLQKDKLLKILRPIFRSETIESELPGLKKKVIQMFTHFMPETLSMKPDLVTHIGAELFGFMSALNKIMKRKESEFKNFTIGEFQRMQDSWNTAKINWLPLLQSLANETEVKLAKSDVIIVDLPFLKDLSKVLFETPHYTIINYMHYSFTMAFEFHDIWNPQEKFTDFSRKSKVCIWKMPIYQGFSSVIINTHLEKDAIDEVKTMFFELRKEMRLKIYRSWLKKKSKFLAIKTLSKMKLLDSKLFFLMNEYAGQILSYDFEITKNIVQNLMNFKRAQSEFVMKQYIYRKSNRRKLRRNSVYYQLGNFLNDHLDFADADNDFEFTREIAFNFRYSMKENAVEVTMGYLFTPLFNMKAPTAVNYGYIGYVLAHEITHMFTSLFNRYLTVGRGGQYSKMNISNIIQNTCFIEQYNKYGVDGKRTMNENIPDSLGLRLAYDTFRIMIQDDRKKDSRIPGLEHLSGDKLFFYTFASTYCEKPSTKYLPRHLHSPSMWRVNGALSNLPAFAKAFNCTRNSPMNPDNKCNLLEKPSTSEFFALKSETQAKRRKFF